MVLFQVPAGHQNSGIEMGMILTCWRGVKAPKIFSGPVNVNACVAFRAVALEVSSEDRLIIEWGWMGQVDHRMFSAKAALVYACICNLFLFQVFCIFNRFLSPQKHAVQQGLVLQLHQHRLGCAP